MIKITVKRLVLLALGALVAALNLKTFREAGGIIPGGFTGLTILTNEIVERFFGIKLPFSVVYYILNAIPVYIGFRYIGKWFTIFSCVNVILTGVFTDNIPPGILDYLNLHDHLLCAVFGGIFSSISVVICLNAEATSGGTDFIAIYFSEKKGTDTWNYIFVANCVMLVIAAVVFEAEKALYSVIYQYAATMTLRALYKGYQQKTLLVITDKAEEITRLIRDTTNHDTTLFTGVGSYTGKNHIMIYSVVSSSEAHILASAIKEIDANAFTNVLRTDLLHGRFYKRPKN